MELEDELFLVEGSREAYRALAPMMARLESSKKLKAFGFIVKSADVKVIRLPAFLQLKKATSGRCEVYSHPLNMHPGPRAYLAAYQRFRRRQDKGLLRQGQGSAS